MALALAKESTECSMCDAPLSEVSLYMCIVDQCNKYGEIFCKDCGTIAHKRKNHKFNTGYFGGNTKQVDATATKNGIKGGMNRVNGTLGAHAENQQKVMRQGTVGVMSSAIMEFAYFEKLSEASIKIAKVATKSGGSGIVGSATDVAKELKFGVEGAGYAAIAVAGFETLFHTIRFMNGDIETWGEYGYHLTQGWTAAAGLYGGNIIGGAIGATIGSIGGPIGTVIGKIIGGIIGGLIGQSCTRTAFDVLFKDAFGGDKLQLKRAQLIKDAVLLFGYASINDLENKNIFNERELKKTYKNLARKHHPDKGGSADGFHTVTAAYGILMALVRKKDKSDVIKKVNQIQKAISFN